MVWGSSGQLTTKPTADPGDMGIPLGLSHRKETVGAEGAGAQLNKDTFDVFVPSGERGCGLVLAGTWR